MPEAVTQHDGCPLPIRQPSEGRQEPWFEPRLLEIVGRIGNVMVGARGATTTEPLRLWEQVSSSLERVANGKAVAPEAAREPSGEPAA